MSKEFEKTVLRKLDELNNKIDNVETKTTKKLDELSNEIAYIKNNTARIPT